MCNTMKTSEARVVLQSLQKAGKTLATAESCTGGWAGKLLTDIPGSSASFLGGVISYTNEVKRKLLNVPQEILDAYGAVSKETAEAMATGVRKAIGADIGASVTGLAGPDSDESGQPVGLVYIAVSTAGKTVCKRLMLQGDRICVRKAACGELFSLITSVLEIG